LATQLSSVRDTPVARIATATLAVDTSGVGFIEITSEVRRFLQAVGGREGTVILFIRHTSASLTIQENADPDVRTDLVTALDRLAPADAGWVHNIEGPDDMPAHVKTMLTGTSLAIPVTAGALALGTWQGIYLAEHRTHPHRREIILQFLGNSV
jgi:secondary thiamine-phosphate synthase enzyme